MANYQLIASLIISEYTPVEILGNKDIVSVMGVAKKIRFPKSEKVFTLTEISHTEIYNCADANTQEVYRSCLRNASMNRAPIFKAVDLDTEIPLPITVWNKRVYRINVPLSHVLDCLTGDDLQYGTISGKKTFAYIQGKFSYAGSWSRFMATYPEIENVSPIYDKLDTISSKTLYESIPDFAIESDEISEVIYRSINRPSKVCKAAAIVDDVVWLIGRSNTADEFKCAKLHDILASLTTFEERTGDEPMYNESAATPKTSIQAAFNKIKDMPKEITVQPTPVVVEPKQLTLTEETKPMEDKPNATIKLPTGSVRAFTSPAITDEELQHILSIVKVKDIAAGNAAKLNKLKLAVPGKSSGAYYIPAYGVYGRVMLNEHNQKTIQAWLGDLKSVAYVGENFKLYYDVNLDPSAVYINGNVIHYHKDSSSVQTPIVTNSTKTVKMENTVNATTTTDTTATATPIKESDVSVGTKRAISYIKESLHLTIMSVNLTDAKPYPTNFDGLWSIVNAGDFSNKVVSAGVPDTTSHLASIEDGVLIVTPTKSFLGSVVGTLTFNTAIVLPEVQEPVIKEVEVTREYTNNELTDAIIAKVKAGEIDAISLIGLITAR